MRWGKGKSPPIHHSDSMDLHSLPFAMFCYAFALYGFEFCVYAYAFVLVLLFI